MPDSPKQKAEKVSNDLVEALMEIEDFEQELVNLGLPGLEPTISHVHAARDNLLEALLACNHYKKVLHDA